MLNAPFLTPYRQSNDIIDTQRGGYHFPTGIDQMPVVSMNVIPDIPKLPNKHVPTTSELPKPISSSVVS